MIVPHTKSFFMDSIMGIQVAPFLGLTRTEILKKNEIDSTTKKHTKNCPQV
jgi:hypothetical protein